MLDPKEMLQDLIDSGFTKEEACLEVRKILKDRNKASLQSEIKYKNDQTNWFRNACGCR